MARVERRRTARSAATRGGTAGLVRSRPRPCTERDGFLCPVLATGANGRGAHDDGIRTGRPPAPPPRPGPARPGTLAGDRRVPAAGRPARGRSRVGVL